MALWQNLGGNALDQESRSPPRQYGTFTCSGIWVSDQNIKTCQKYIRGSLGQIIGSDNALISLFSADDGHLLGKVR